ncbi:sensor histidine kinase [Streptomyces sp. cg36]|uniref:sensor histidine kinase n=1 Tax=Streptomyces sp. cg36 TaxID=3238798 RepID=UPI0034E1DA44
MLRAGSPHGRTGGDGGQEPGARRALGGWSRCGGDWMCRADQADPQLERCAAGMRLALLAPLVLTGLTVIDSGARGAYWVLLAAFAVWSVLQAWHLRWRAATRLNQAVAVLLTDLAVLALLAELSGGPYSPVCFVYFLVPLTTVLWQLPRVSVVVGMLCIGVYAVLALVNLSPPRRSPDLGMDLLIQGVYLMWLSGVATTLCVLLSRRSRRVAQLLSASQTLLEDALAAEERERAELADQLHDGAVQSLLAACQDLEEVAEEGTSPALERATACVRQTVAELRETVLDLHPQVLAAVGLAEALRQAGGRAAQRGGLDVRYAMQPRGHVPGEPLIYAAVREALANVVRHAEATRVRIELRGEDRHTVACVVDDGVGFAPALLTARIAEGHIGLASHRVRIESAGGTFRVESTPGCGTRVEIRLPSEGVRLRPRAPGATAAAAR